jgi:hypothetical protein
VTLLLSIKVNDGLGLASDTVVVLTGRDTAGNKAPVHVYRHARKLLPVRGDLPIGLQVSGQAAIGDTSIAVLAKELDRRQSGKRPSYADWAIPRWSRWMRLGIRPRVYGFRSSSLGGWGEVLALPCG